MSLTDKHSFNSYSSIHSYPSECGGQLSVPGSDCFLCSIFSLRWLKQLFTFWVYLRWICCQPPVPPQCWQYYILESPPPLGVLGLNVFNHPWTFQVSYVFPLPALVPLALSKFLPKHGQRSTQTFDSSGTMLDGGSLASHNLNMLADILWHCPIIKDPTVDVSVVNVLKGLPHLHFNSLASQRCVLCKQGFSFLSLSSSGRGNQSMSKVYHSVKCSKEWACWCAQECVPNNTISCP